jgi:drug/metabolite transporter (DMT)-like permease
MPRLLAVAMLLTTTSIWGFAFVAQKSAMDTMGPYTFAAARYLLGGLCILPLALGEWTRRHATALSLTPRQWWLIAIIIAAFVVGSLLQQVGLQTTTATNAGFLTGLYVIFTPLLAYLIYRTAPHPILYVCVPLAMVGLYFLNGGRLDTFSTGDLLIIGCAVAWGLQILLIGIVSKETGLPIFISVACFVATGLIAFPLALGLESPTFEGLSAGWVQIAYAGILSTAVAFTFQAIAQQHLPPSNAAIINSSETLFAAIGGALLLGERLTPVGYVGATLMLVAIVAVEAVPPLTRRKVSTAA